MGIRQSRISIGHKGASVTLSLAENNFTTSPQIYGIVPNKSHVETKLPIIFKDNEELFFQFLKGLVDGDGTIHTQKGSYGISIVNNSKTLLEKIKFELERYIPEPTSIWIMERTKEQQIGKNATQSLYILKMGSGIYNHSNLKYVYQQFYGNSPIILTRKQENFKSIL